MQMARAAGMPVPYVVSYGEHPSSPFPYSILMTQLPGFSPINFGMLEFVPEYEDTWLPELTRCVHAMRQWENPFGEKRICSAIGTPINSSIVQTYRIGPFDTEKQFIDFLLFPATDRDFTGTKEQYQEKLALARKMYDMHHRIVFTHGDLLDHNILINDDHELTGLLDWECAGWLPEHWETTTGMRFNKAWWWSRIMFHVGGNRYEEEDQSERARRTVTADSWVFCM